MANLYGRLWGDERGAVTRTAHRTVTSKLETWDGSVRTELDANGDFRVFVGGKHENQAVPRFTGNVNEREVEA